MPVSISDLAGSPTTIGVTLIVGLGAFVYLKLIKSNEEKQLQKGMVIVCPKSTLNEEYSRDFLRFLKSGSIKILSDRELRIATESDIVNTVGIHMYSLSTSMGVDVLSAMGYHPPVMYQPLFVVDGVKVVLYGFIGGDVCGDRPDRKYTSKICTIEYDGVDKCGYRVHSSGGIRDVVEFVENEEKISKKSE